MDDLARTLERQGITLTPEQLELIEPVFRAYVERLTRLRTLDLEEAEAAFVFRPT
jgi:hypothetical protein